MAGRLLVTGASGFVGQRLLPILMRAGYAIVAPVRTEQAPQPGIVFSLADSIETTDWSRFLDGADAGPDAPQCFGPVRNTRDVHQSVNAPVAALLSTGGNC